MNQTRRGFSLVELVVAIFILVLLAVLLIPARINSGRPSMRSQCKNNLKQLGLALHNYHEVVNTLPPGWVSSNGFGWNPMLLPQMDQAPLYNRLNFESVWTADSVNPMCVLPMLRCPADKGTNTVGAPVLSVSAARSNYPGVSGATRITSKTIAVTDTRGTFGENSRRNFQ